MTFERGNLKELVTDSQGDRWLLAQPRKFRTDFVKTAQLGLIAEIRVTFLTLRSDIFFSMSSRMALYD